MILIANGGFTGTTWAAVKKGRQIKRLYHDYKSHGINRVDSVGFVFGDILIEVPKEFEIHLERLFSHPWMNSLNIIFKSSYSNHSAHFNSGS